MDGGTQIMRMTPSGVYFSDGECTEIDALSPEHPLVEQLSARQAYQLGEYIGALRADGSLPERDKVISNSRSGDRKGGLEFFEGKTFRVHGEQHHLSTFGPGHELFSQLTRREVWSIACTKTSTSVHTLYAQQKLGLLEEI